MQNKITYSHLTDTDLLTIHKTFMEAFADYQVDTSYMTLEVMRNRFIKNNVNFNCSVGVFDGERLVGFTMIGLDEFKNSLSAFDAMTGIIKNYRGMGLAKKMFDFALPKLKQNGIEKFVLEVLRPNENAVKAYTKAGFTISRQLDCFELVPNQIKTDCHQPEEVEIKEVQKEKISEFGAEQNWVPSFEQSTAGILRIENQVTSLGAYIQNQLVGILVYYPTLKWIMQIIVKEKFRRRGLGTSLIKKLIDELPENPEKIYYHNIEASQKESLKFLNNIGFVEIMGQFEMELKL